MATVSSVLWESTTMISSAQATDSRQAAMLEDSLRVMTVTVSFTPGSVQDRGSGARGLGGSGARGERSGEARRAAECSSESEWGWGPSFFDSFFLLLLPSSFLTVLLPGRRRRAMSGSLRRWRSIGCSRSSRSVRFAAVGPDHAVPGTGQTCWRGRRSCASVRPRDGARQTDAPCPWLPLA